MGIGLRVAGRVAGEKIAGSSPAAQPPRAPVSVVPVRSATERGQQAAATARNVGRAAQMGAGGFFRSFRRAGSIVWLQVTGSFFFLPVLAFAPKLWQARASWQQGPDHRTFVATAILVVVFSYLGATSFWRAARK